ncbi:2-hydroxyhepta-2,4-diene-1,7-dioate isomerase [Gloeomargarita lithophora Alchichica-D10]|uniref:2-hydroxyhepta-2,4-diene-1,7-dioate isomerase n=1 Tax=Gloeomargarita lithophora Alchichica-D10 TaxID=1188229 RepID=A0A1J0AEK6_9CYAN|nr:fumarylacetoacetate hydrolase family protein [Gloeomargarita lithophora]APB34372.1 2-hydroxyhepta-2,4-diene-1,7-dioate isomerase [Gloeomargarita lithophora Alchichica-D10]
MQTWVRVRAGDQVVYGELGADQGVQVWTDAPWWGGTAMAEQLAPGTYQLLAPTLPSKIIAAGRNYVDHAAEMKATVPVEPVIFLKPPTTVLAPGGEIRYPAQSRRVDYEGELAVVIGQTASRLTPEEAVDAIWGYTIANDVTARDLQKRDEQWTRSKGFDTFCPLGPGIVRELSFQAEIETYLNGQRKQAALLQDMVFKPPVLVSYISQVMTLLPGDVILTGTPAGIGPLQPGDAVEVRITGLGTLANRVVA